MVSGGAGARADRQLIERVRGGDAGAFDELVRITMRRAFAVAWRVLRQREDAEDVVQESYLVLLQKIETYDPRREFEPWFLRIVVNRSLNALKARRRRRAAPLPEEARAAAGPPAAHERTDADRRLERALAALPERQGLILRLFELEGYSSAEIGRMLGLSDGTVRWHLHRARGALRAVLAPGGTS
jgi:RNA polymerase sigma-70 factor (ECF subfamily)